jgi:chromosome segregation ATPase
MSALRVLILFALSMLCVGCASTARRTPPPARVNVPVRAKAVDISPVSSSVTKARESVDRTSESARILERTLANVASAVSNVKTEAEAAFVRGVRAGSVEAIELREGVKRIAEEIASAKVERDALAAEIIKTKSALSDAALRLTEVTSQVSAANAESDNLRASVAEANTRLEKGAQQITDLQVYSAKQQAVIDGNNKVIRRLLWTLAVITLLIVTYLVGRTQGWGFIK